MAKGFDTFCPVSAYLSKNAILDHQNVDLWLKVNGELRQKGNTRDMIFGYASGTLAKSGSINELISRISRVMRLQPGDFILTGMCSCVSTAV